MNSKDDSFNTIEKITFYGGLLILVALVGYLIFQITQKKSEPPQLKISTSYRPELPQFTFKVVIENTGGETAEAVNLKLDLYQHGKVVESGTVTVNFVPVHSKKTALIVFDEERNGSDSLVVSSLTYIVP